MQQLAADQGWLARADRQQPWLVGVSGGADSVAILHWLLEQNFPELIVCHVDHQLRGDASAGDAAFVARLAESLKLPLRSTRIDLAAQIRSSGGSIETAARNARHAFFHGVGRAESCSRLILAHHADDQAETVWWNLLRGSHGLRGMSIESTHRAENPSDPELVIHRPWLGVRRAEIHAWLRERGISWREDATNVQPLAIRNRLRNEALPLLAEITSRDPVPATLRALAAAHDRAEIAAWAVAQANAEDPQGRLHLGVMRSLPTALQREILADYLIRNGIPSIDAAHIHRAIGILAADAPPVVNLPGGRQLRRRAGRVFLGN